MSSLLPWDQPHSALTLGVKPDQPLLPSGLSFPGALVCCASSPTGWCLFQHWCGLLIAAALAVSLTASALLLERHGASVEVLGLGPALPSILYPQCPQRTSPLLQTLLSNLQK